MEYMEQYDRNTWEVLTKQLKEEVKLKQSIIPTNFIPHSNKIPTREEFEEYHTNNEKMAARLAKEDKTKRVEIDKPEGRLNKFRVTKKQIGIVLSGIRGFLFCLSSASYTNKS
ncbi:hypothetical protein RhiirA1_491103 [Rhizophagus irregularis]|uniref:Uncharacterized protein n=1 Tax=Rhizophagus irregularis TaxID=588596 RepID=A0A2N0RA41_9GLOM|nr:hypothetical protein RhiirA1_491103 [Rhizophagus irregularis]